MPTLTKTRVEKRIARLLPKARWFRGKARRIEAVEIIDRVPLSPRDDAASLTLARVAYAGGGSEIYTLFADEVGGKLADVASRADVADALRLVFTSGQELRGSHGAIAAVCAPEACRDLAPSADPLAARALDAEQSNTSIVFGDQYLLKLYRVVEPGISPEAELTQFLTACGFRHAPATFGTLSYRPHQGPETTLGVLQAFVRGAADGWTLALKSVERAFDAARAGETAPPAEADGERGRTGDDFAPLARLLGERTAELHLALGSSTADAALAPEPFGETGGAELAASLSAAATRTLDLLAERAGKLKGKTRELAMRLLEVRNGVTTRLQSVATTKLASSRLRCHGDFHLGQVLSVNGDFFICDFEGEVARPMAERRSKRSPLCDVASMVRSFHYAASAPLQDLPARARERRLLETAAHAWCEHVSESFLRSYLAAVREAPFLPRDLVEEEKLYKAHLLEKALYEVAYELSSRPKWLWIPLQGVLQAM